VKLVLTIAAGIWISVVAVALLVLGFVTAFRARRLYSAIVRGAAVVLLRMYGIRVRVQQDQPFPRTQTIYVSNHTSTLDLFVLVALGLPNCRFFLSGFLRKYVPLGVIAWLLGTFFTVPQDRPAERTRIFMNVERVLRATGESVYLSPEGGRITSGAIGHFNKGAFHLATNLRVPIVPFYIHIPSAIDPQLGYDARPGVIEVHVLPAIDTRQWTLDNLTDNAARTRELFVIAQKRFHVV
jgi:1-acyl-sn-glycerol-3-phosphate acyltransferase